MDIEGFLILTQTQMDAWKAAYETEYQYYVDEGLLDEDSGYLYDDPPEWMYDGDDTNGPFDFKLHPSQATIGW